MATQFDPIAKDESLNTTEVSPRNIADVLAEELSAIEQAIAGGSGSGGHTIVNASGTDMTQRAKMQFVDAVVTDDAANDVTKISTTPASYPSANVTYGSGSVEDALDDLTPTTALTFATANTTYVSNVRRTEYVKVGKVVNFNIFFDLNAAPTNGSVLFTINDSKLFPKIDSVVPLVGTLINSAYKVNLNPNGNIELNSTQTISPNSFYAISGTYICVDE